MTWAGLFRWLPVLARFSAGQVAILAINLVTGFLILRLLSINEYAIYILASVLQGLGSLGTDLGMSQGVVSIGAPIREDKAAFGRLVRGATRLRGRLFLVVTPIVLAAAYMLLDGDMVHLDTALAVTGLALVIAWVQQSASIATAVLNANHDSTGLLRSGAASAVARLILVAGLCSMAPYAIAALAINLAGTAINATLLRRRCDRYVTPVDDSEVQRFSGELVAFMKPLFPGIVYYFFQGNISTFLLAFAGATVAIAEVGALGRLGQIVGILLLVNGFFIQPYFARISDRKVFISRTIQVLLALIVAFAAITLSAALAPSVWLAILGPTYSGLDSEVLIALASVQFSTAAVMLYTIVIATQRTQGQWIQIPLGLAMQFLYILAFGIASSRDALLLNLIPSAIAFAVECGLLVYVIVSWRTPRPIA